MCEIANMISNAVDKKRIQIEVNNIIHGANFMTDVLIPLSNKLEEYMKIAKVDIDTAFVELDLELWKQLLQNFYKNQIRKQKIKRLS